MSRIRKTAIVVTLSASLSLLAVCGENEWSSPARAQEATTYTMRVGSVVPEGTPWEKQLRYWKRLVEERAGGRIRVRLFMGGSLGGEKAMVDQVVSGQLDAYAGSAGSIATVVPELSVIEAPYLLSDWPEVDAVLDDEEVERQTRGLLATKNMVFNIWSENGFLSWFTRDRAIQAPTDLRGLRMRSQESAIHIDAYEAFGATAHPIDATNALTALSSGIVDGFDQTPLFAYAAAWYQSATRLTLSRHSYQPGLSVYSASFLASLPEDLRQAILDMPLDAVRDAHRGEIRRMDEAVTQVLRTKLQVHDPTAEERAAFAAIGSRVQDRRAHLLGRAAERLLRAIRGARDASHSQATL